MSACDQGNTLHHTAIFVKDIRWYIDFFEKALGMSVTRYEGVVEHPNQAWLCGGVQLIEKSDFNDESGQMAHLGIACTDQSSAITNVRPYALCVCPQGENWLRLPDGLVLELMQA